MNGLRPACRAEPRAAEETAFALSDAACCASWEGRLGARPRFGYYLFPCPPGLFLPSSPLPWLLELPACVLHSARVAIQEDEDASAKER